MEDYERNERNERSSERTRKLTYLEMAKAVPPPVGKSASHPWKGMKVRSPRGEGRLISADGFRAAISTQRNLAYIVELVDVTLVKAGD